MAPEHEISSSMENQRTVKNAESISGIGLFTGVKTQMTFIPAEPGFGVVFERTDLPGSPRLPAQVDFVKDTPRCTILGNSEITVQTVEHVLSALRAYEIDNVLISLTGPEVPSCDGSATPFVDLIEKCGIKVQEAMREVMRLHVPVFWSRGDVHLVALPSDEFRVSYTLNYPNSALLRSQFHTVIINHENFKNEIAPARTFSLYEEIVPLIEQGSIKGGNLENAVIVKDDAVLNPDGVRFQDEMARHKILDLVGDLSLIGKPFLAHIIAIRSGHFSNTSLAKELVNYFAMESCSV